MADGYQLRRSDSIWEDWILTVYECRALIGYYEDHGCGDHRIDIVSAEPDAFEKSAKKRKQNAAYRARKKALEGGASRT